MSVTIQVLARVALARVALALALCAAASCAGPSAASTSSDPGREPAAAPAPVATPAVTKSPDATSPDATSPDVAAPDVAAPDATSPDTSLASAGSKHAPFGDLRVGYDDVGLGERALVFVHGWAGDRSVWRNQVPAMLRVMRCLALDLPGHGESPRPAEALTMDLFADAVVAVMDDAGVRQAVLVGHGNGASVVRQVLRRHPERVAGLVLVDGSLRYPFVDRATAESLLAPYRSPGYRETARQTILSVLRPDMPTALKIDLTQRMLATPQDVLLDAFEAAVDPALFAPDPIEVPLLCLLARSPFWSDDYEDFVTSLAPSADYTVLEDVGHFVMLDAPARFNELIELFVWAWDLRG